MDGVTVGIACGGVSLGGASAIAAWRASRAVGRSAKTAEDSALESRKVRQDRLGSNLAN